MATKARTAGAAALALLLIGAWSLLPEGPDGPVASGTGTSTHAAAPGSPAVPEGSSQAARADPGQRRRAVPAPGRDPSPTGAGVLDIRTVDGAGEPVAGVPVAIRVESQRGNHDEWSGRTAGPRGEVRITEPKEQLRTELGPGIRAIARVDAALSEPVEVLLDLDAKPIEPVRLEVPESGLVVVQLQRSDGSALLGKHWVHLTPLLPHPFESARDLRGERVSLLARDGRARFAPVQTGLRLQADFRDPESYDQVTTTIDGPTSAGEAIEVALRMSPHRHRIRARIVDGRGEPVVNASLKLLYEEAEGAAPDRSFRPRTRSDSAGGIELTLVSPAPSLCFYGARLVLDESDRPAQRAELGTLTTRRERPTELGDVVLEPLPLVARGRVVDSEGQPVHWATVRTQQKRNERGGPYSRREHGEDFVWHWVNELQVPTDRQGRFEVRGLAPSPHLSLIASKTGYLDSERGLYTPGDEGIELVLEPVSALTGSLRLDEGIDPRQLVVEVAGLEVRSFYDDAGGNYHDTFRRTPDERSAFAFESLTPGLATVRVFLADESEPLAVVQDVSVAAGETSRDPRLDPLDLRGRIERVTITVVAGDGAGAPEGHVAILAPDAEAPRTRRELLSDGRVELLLRSVPVDLEVHGHGYRTRLLHDIVEDTTVSLEPGLPIELRLPPDLDPPRAPLALHAIAQPLEWSDALYEALRSEDAERDVPWTQWIQWRSAPFAADGSLELRLPVEGEYRIAWYLAPSEGARMRSIGGYRHEDYFEVLAGSTPLSLVRGPDPRQLRQAIRALQEGR